jgi:hypothetical protein
MGWDRSRLRFSENDVRVEQKLINLAPIVLVRLVKNALT